METIISSYQQILHYIAELTIHTLELIGICIVIIGSVKAIIQILSNLKRERHINVMVNLGRALALSLEFKMGAEIVKTVIVRDLRELGILAIVIALRAVLSLLIHWEIKNEQKVENGKMDNRSDKE